MIASGSNWSFWIAGAGQGTVLRALEGAFDPSAGVVTAVMSPSGSCFNQASARARFTGTRSGNSVQLQSQLLLGQAIFLTGTLSPTGDAFDGTYSITGGCGNGVSGRVIGRYVNLTGIWSGTLGAIPTVFDLQMASTPEADGTFSLSGSAKFSGTSCFPNATITRGDGGRGRTWLPDVVGESQRLELIAPVSEDLSSMYIAYVLVSGVCPELNFGDGRLFRQ